MVITLHLVLQFLFGTLQFKLGFFYFFIIIQQDMISKQIHKVMMNTVFYEYFPSFENFFGSQCIIPKALLNNSLRYQIIKFANKNKISGKTMRRLLRYSFYLKFLKETAVNEFSKSILEIMQSWEQIKSKRTKRELLDGTLHLIILKGGQICVPKNLKVRSLNIKGLAEDFFFGVQTSQVRKKGSKKVKFDESKNEIKHFVSISEEEIQQAKRWLEPDIEADDIQFKVWKKIKIEMNGKVQKK